LCIAFCLSAPHVVIACINLTTQGVAKRENHIKMYSRPQKGLDKNSLEASKKI